MGYGELEHVGVPQGMAGGGGQAKSCSSSGGALCYPGRAPGHDGWLRVGLVDGEVQKGFLMPLCFQFIPESARYNVSTGNVAAALATLRRIAKMNRAAMPEGVLREPAKVSRARGAARPLRPGQGCWHLGFKDGAGQPSTSRSASLPPPRLVSFQTTIECNNEGVFFFFFLKRQ